MTTITDHVGAIGDPAAYSRENAKRGEKERNKAKGATEPLSQIEKIRLSEMIAAETHKYREAADKLYPDLVQVEKLKPLIQKVDQDDPYWKKIIKVANTETGCKKIPFTIYSFTYAHGGFIECKISNNAPSQIRINED